MKIDPIKLILKKELIVNKKIFFISGNEITLMNKIKDTITQVYNKYEKKVFDKYKKFLSSKNDVSLFGSKQIYIFKDISDLSKEYVTDLVSEEDIYIFLIPNSPKTKILKNIFYKRQDTYVVDCYDLDISKKTLLLNNFLNQNMIKIDNSSYWSLIDSLDNRYMFFENELKKIGQLEIEDISEEIIKELIPKNVTGKEKIFFNIFKKNKELTVLYREKIINNSDVNEFYYFCKFFCLLIINNKSEEDYINKVPKYLFKEKKQLVEIYRKFNLKNKRVLLKLMDKTEKNLRLESDFSLAVGFRFLLGLKKIIVS